ncbi:MAG: hypothetical protein Q9175_006577 [Cornicularia normoerica]
MGDMEPTLGPATLSHARPPNRNPGLTRYSNNLKFYPPEHMATTPDTQVWEVELEVGKVYHEADGLDEGISAKTIERRNADASANILRTIKKRLA